MIVTIGGIPVYDAIITDDGTGMMKISLVDDPAVMSDFQAFDASRKMQMYAVTDEEKRLVRGVVMRADFPIYRRDERMGEYYIIYKADTIRQMAEKYLAESRQNDVNLMHQEGSDVEGVQMVQYFIKGDGVSVDGFDDIADGSLFAEFHITNDEVWEEVKAGTYKGFSLEGYFDLVPETDVDEVDQIVRDLKGAFEKTFNKFKDMSKLKKLFAALTAYLQMGNVTTDKGVLAWDGEDDLKAGDAVYLVDQDGNRSDAPDGEYRTDDNKVIVVVDGKVSEIKDAEAEVAPQNEPEETEMIQTDKGKLEWDNEDEDLKAGDAVYIRDEEGNRNPAPDGDYTTEDGKVIKVKDGIVTEIVDDKAEVSEEEKKVSKFRRIKEAFEETYDEKMQKIREAIYAVRGESEEWWLVEAGDDFAVINAFDIETWEEHYFRYVIKWNEDGSAEASDETEVKLMFVPMDYKSPWEDGSSDEVEALRQENESLKAEVAKLKATPAAKPAHKEVVTAGKTEKTGVKGLDRLSRYVDAVK